MARWRLQRGTGRGNRSTGERLSRPLEGAKPARRGLHLLSPLFGSDTAPAPVTSLRLLVIRRARSGPFTVRASVISRTLAQVTLPSLRRYPRDLNPIGDRNPMTLVQLSQRLGVPLVDVVRAAMALGVSTTATQPLAAKDVDLVEKLLRLDQA